MENPLLWAGLLLTVWALLLFFSCLLEEEWWPLFNVFFVLIGALPYVFGSHHSTELWGAIGDFSSGILLVSMFAFPIVLHNANVIHFEALLAISLSSVSFMGGVSILLACL